MKDTVPLKGLKQDISQTHTSAAVSLSCRADHQYVFLYSFWPVPMGATEAESAEESYALGLE